MKAILLACATALGAVGLAAADPTRMTDVQLDQVTAGVVSSVSLSQALAGKAAAVSRCSSGGCSIADAQAVGRAFARARGCFNSTCVEDVSP